MSEKTKVVITCTATNKQKEGKPWTVTVNQADSSTYIEGLLFSQNADAIKVYPHTSEFQWVTMIVNKTKGGFKNLTTNPETFFLEDISSIILYIEGDEECTYSGFQVEITDPKMEPL